MRAFVTGATGFIGGRLVRRLRARGDDVVALVRRPERAVALRDLGCWLVQGDVGDGEAIRSGLSGCDAAFHVAGMYRIGIPASERQDMFETNVRGTERVLDEAAAAGTRRIVYVSTVNVFGNTRGVVVDETYERPVADGFLSAYDETKYRAHRAARDRIERGAPILIAMPGGVYGPGDTSELSTVIDQVRTGRLRLMTFPELGFNFLHVEDAADGLLRIHDRGRTGSSYVLGGELTTMRQAVRIVAELAGRRPPRWAIPVPLIRAAVPLAPVVTRLMHLPPNLRELIRAADGVTYWARDDRARTELGYSPRDLRTGLTQTLSAVSP